MAAPREVVSSFAAALANRDFTAARSLLADDLHFVGPIDEFHRADDYMSAIQGLFGAVRGIEDQATIAQDADVVRFYVLDTPMARAPVAEWFTVGDDRIRKVRAYFDARPFAPPG